MSSSSKNWKTYETYLMSGLWHVHTEITDGKNSVRELFEFATENEFPFIGFVEHIRKDPTYDFATFTERVHARAREYDIDCAVGCEAKVMSEDGELDVSEEDVRRADVVYAAYHGTPFGRSEYLESAYAMLENPIVDVWAHPFAYPHREGLGIPLDTVTDVLEYAEKKDVLVEYNLRYDLPPPVAKRCRAHGGIIGYDLHDVDRWWSV